MAAFWLARMRDRARSTFWLTPALCAAAGIGLAIGLVATDRVLGDRGTTYLFPGPPEGARALLGAIISAMISLTALVFSITVVVLVLTSGQFSPRVLRRFLRDRTIQWSLGIFVATFVYAMTVIRTVLGTNNTGAFVPRIAVTTAFLLVLLSVGLFIYYIHHITHVIRAASIISAIGVETRALLERRCPADLPPPAQETANPPGDTAVSATRPGVVVSVHEAAIVARAAQEDQTIVLVPRVGDFVPQGAPLFRVCGGASDLSWVHSKIILADERTMEQDLAFGFRQLVDIAERALSPGINDPTTACQAIDALHELLRRLATRPLPTGHHADTDGRIRLVVPQYDFAGYLQLALAEVWLYGSGSAQVPERLATLVRDLGSAALPEYRAAIQRWARVIEPVVARRRSAYPDLPHSVARSP